jgi:hypothetical protein
VTQSPAGDGKSIALPLCQSVCRTTIIPANNLWGISGRPHTRTHGAFRGMPRAQKAKFPGGRPGGVSLYQAKSNGLNGNPGIYKKAAAFRHLRHNHFGAVIAHYIVPNPSIRIDRPMRRLGHRLHWRLNGETQSWNLRVNLTGWKAIDQNWETEPLFV